MESIKRTILIIIGFISLGIGILGVLLPVLPTTPFLILSSVCFFKGSKKINSWFENTKFYEKYVKDFKEKRGLTLKRKLTILVTADCLIILSIVLIRNIYMTIFLLVVIITKFWYFIFKVKTLAEISEVEE